MTAARGRRDVWLGHTGEHRGWRERLAAKEVESIGVKERRRRHSAGLSGCGSWDDEWSDSAVREETMHTLRRRDSFMKSRNDARQSCRAERIGGLAITAIVFAFLVISCGGGAENEEPTETPGAPQQTRPPASSPARPSSTLTPESTWSRSPTPLPAELPDLVIREMGVIDDTIWLVVGNDGAAELPAGQQIEARVRGLAVEPVALEESLVPGGSQRIVLENEVIYGPELVLAVVDPLNVILEENDANNGLSEELSPDVALDLAAESVSREPGTNRLEVLVRNPTRAPAFDVAVTVTTYLEGAAEPTDRATHRLTIGPLGSHTVDILGAAAIPGAQVRVVVEMTDPQDANPDNNVFEGVIP